MRAWITALAVLLLAGSAYALTGWPRVTSDCQQPTSRPAEIVLACETRLALHDTFTGKRNGPLTTAASGQAWTPVGASGSQFQPGGTLSIIHGQMTNTARPSGPSAGYAEARLRANVTRIGSQFTFAPGSTLNGAAGVIVWDTDLAASFPRIPNSPLHFAIGTHTWSYSVVIAGVFHRIARGILAHPLATNGKVTYRVEILISGRAAAVLITGSDGSIPLRTSVSDPRIGQLAGRYPTFEVFGLHSQTDSKAAFQQVWADDAPISSRKRSDVLTQLRWARFNGSQAIGHGLDVTNRGARFSVAPVSVDLSRPRHCPGSVRQFGRIALSQHGQRARLSLPCR